MALTVSSIVGNVSGHINNDRYLALAPAAKTAVDQVMTELNGIDWSQPQDLVNIIETKVSEVAAATGYDADFEKSLNGTRTDLNENVVKIVGNFVLKSDGKIIALDSTSENSSQNNRYYYGTRTPVIYNDCRYGHDNLETPYTYISTFGYGGIVDVSYILNDYTFVDLVENIENHQMMNQKKIFMKNYQKIERNIDI